MLDCFEHVTFDYKLHFLPVKDQTVNMHKKMKRTRLTDFSGAERAFPNEWDLCHKGNSETWSAQRTLAEESEGSAVLAVEQSDFGNWAEAILLKST